MVNSIFTELDQAARRTCRRTYILPGFFLLSFFLFCVNYPPSSLNGAQTKIGHMLGSKCYLKMYVQNMGIPPLQVGGPKPLFSTSSQLHGNFDGLYLRNKISHT